MTPGREIEDDLDLNEKRHLYTILIVWYVAHDVLFRRRP